MVRGRGDMDKPIIDVVCPIYKDYEQIKCIIESIKKQKDVFINRIVCPFTLSNNEIDVIIEKYLIENEVTYFKLNKDEFSHSLTREKAIREYCQSVIVVLLSQDVRFVDDFSISILAKSINDDVVYSYGRQICTRKSIEKYIREKNYPDNSIVVSKKDIKAMQLMAFFASDAFSAINRNVFLNIGGYRDFNVMMSEDMLYSKFVLDAGYKKMYVASAIVEHSHKYRLKELYERYYQIGLFYRKVKFFDEYKSTDSGMKLAFYVLKTALKNFDVPVLFRFIPDMTARYFGMRKGRNINV